MGKNKEPELQWLEDMIGGWLGLLLRLAGTLVESLARLLAVVLVLGVQAVGSVLAWLVRGDLPRRTAPRRRRRRRIRPRRYRQRPDPW